MHNLQQKVRIYNTLSGKKEKFVPVSDQVRILLCGPTVYDYSHVGHARMLLCYDLISRYLRSKGIGVSVVVNITDIDPKIFRKSRIAGIPPADFATTFISELLNDLASLRIDNFAFARVSDHVSRAKELINKLLKEKKAYFDGGNIYLDTSRIRSLGKLSRMTRDDLKDCRLEISPFKRCATDIMLWNSSDDFEEVFKDNMLGDGVPWWHMQDSSVAVSSFAGVYDIHGGASELVYPHHESHLAQLMAITSLEMPVRFWTHVALVRIKGRKMSKSHGNVVLLRELLARYTANVLRLYLFSRHYREIFEFDEDELDKFVRIDNLLLGAMSDSASGGNQSSDPLGSFFNCIENDLDSPGAINVMIKTAQRRGNKSALKVMANVFGLCY